MSDEDENNPEEQSDDWADALANQAEEEVGEAANNSEDSDELIDDVSPVGLNQLNENTSTDATGNPNLDVILDIPVQISMEVGSAEITIRNLLKLNQGSVVELDRLAGEPLNVLVNGTLVAHGEVVVVNEKFGIRLTDVLSPAERIQRLR